LVGTLSQIFAIKWQVQKLVERKRLTKVGYEITILPNYEFELQRQIFFPWMLEQTKSVRT